LISDAGRRVAAAEQFIGPGVVLRPGVGEEVQVGPADPPPTPATVGREPLLEQRLGLVGLAEFEVRLGYRAAAVFDHQR
jgi:hypothetical protein